MFAPDRQGFFPGLWVQFVEDLSQQERQEFSSLTTREERLTWMYGRRLVAERLELLRNMMRSGGVKDAQQSQARRETGNQYFLAGDLHTAMVNYSRAVVLAEDGSQNLAAAFANRAACLQRLGCPEFALTDLALAEENKYQPASIFKIWERRAQCLLTLRRYKEAKIAFEETLACVRTAKLEGKKRTKLLQDVKEGLEKIRQAEADKLQSDLPTKSTADLEKEAILTVERPHSQFPSASSQVSVRYQKGRGRYVEASQEIPVGTTLLRESPITWALHPERFGSHCQDCLAQVKSVIPCPLCSSVCFCSVACRDRALASYHQYECEANNLLIASGLNIYPALTYRILARFGLDHLWSLREELEQHDDTAGATTTGQYREDDFVNAYNLVCHEDKVTEEEQLLRTFVSVFLLKLLQFNNYFGNYSDTETFPELTEKYLYVGRLLLHFSHSLPQNVHDIAVLETSETRRWVNSAEIKSLGAGVYLTGALFNHSCDPSFMRCNVGKDLVSVSNRRIQPGEEISECYGQMYYSKSLETRRGQLEKHYKFHCQCEACLYNWPTIKDLRYASGGGNTNHQDLMRIRCQTCGQVMERLKGLKVASILTCLVCGQESEVKNIPLETIRKASNTAESLLCDKLAWREGIKAVSDCQFEFDKYLVAPCIELYNTQIAIWRAMWIIVGNKKIVKGLI